MSVGRVLATAEAALLDAQVDHLSACRHLPEAEVVALAAKCKELLLREPNVSAVKAPVVIVGDTHGQFHDLAEVFRVAGPAPDTNYLFLGDYVDRCVCVVMTRVEEEWWSGVC